MADTALKIKEIALTGKLITSVDASTIDTNFQSLKNLRYTQTGLRAIQGMSKINTTALTTYLKIRSGIHFAKYQPAETHVLVQAYNTGLTASQVLQNTTAIPDQGDFSGTALHTDASGAGVGRFANVSQGQLVYCNGVESMIWGGDEYRVAGFINGDSGLTAVLDYADQVRNTSTGALNTATLTQDYLYIGSTLPLQGFKLTVGVVNAAAATMVVKYWTGSAWSSDILGTDGTASGGAPLGQSGAVTFSADTESTAKPRMINGVILYWYQVYIASMDNTTTVTYCTVDASFQSVKDIWDGTDRTILAAITNKGTDVDYTVNVIEENYNTAAANTYADIGSLATSDEIYLGFSERMMGFFINMAYDHPNTGAAVMTVKYWDGSAWATVGTIQDATLVGGVSLNKSGSVTWTPPAATSESKTIVAKGIPLYYYQITFSGALTAAARYTYVAGITAQKNISGYKFPVYAHNRVWLTGISLYSQFGSSLYNLVVFFKAHETWILIGSNPEDWVTYPANENIGCVAPATLQRVNLGAKDLPDQNRYVVIFQAAEGIYMFDGKNMKLLSEDIGNFFDHRSAETINEDKLKDSVSFFDNVNREYHWLFASGSSTTLDKEMVYDLTRDKWYEPSRGTGKAIQYGFSVKETNGDIINYGSLDTGYMERLENGNDFDGADIVTEWQFGDMAIHNGSMFTKTILRKVKLVTVAKTVTGNSVTMTHYGDTSTTGTGTASTMAPTRTGYRLADKTWGQNSKPRVYHSLKFTMSTNNESTAFEPIAVGLGYDIHSIDLN
jgi:hypothetical protein